MYIINFKSDNYNFIKKCCNNLIEISNLKAVLPKLKKETLL